MFLWVTGVGCALFFSCCVVSLLVLGAVSDENSPTPLSVVTEPLALGETISLGTVVVPEGATPAEDHDYRWPWDWKRYSLDYGVDSDVREGADRDLEALAKRMRYASNGNQFRWSPPSDCEDDPWQCVYAQSASDNRPYVQALAEVFRRQQEARGLDARATVELVVSWVQHITYKLPDEEPFGLLPAARVAAEGWGDCDSKVLLAGLVLDELGIDTVMLHSESYKHAALGVAIPASGDCWSWRGRRYYYVEVTAPGWSVGSLPPEVDTRRAWRVLPWK